ncbi:hypothetical protein [Leptospira interrogans]|uniref:hypothetical protein n=1 Tax=Leptospira interrogans TaxID=173 RepID=UPI00077465FB|nr:hypothetical protein [Leptospira interrogans]MBM2888386.1 hypothetical protein [Leptospira interrogans]
MEKLEIIFSNIKVDKDLQSMSLDALKEMANQSVENYIPIYWNHDFRNPPIGRIISADVREIDNGHFELYGIGEYFDAPVETFSSEKSIYVETTETSLFSVEYDTRFITPESEIALKDLLELSTDQHVSLVNKSDSYDEYLIIKTGIFVAGTIVAGMLSKFGQDIYSKLKENLIKYFKIKANKEYLIIQFLAKKENWPFEINTMVLNSDVKTINKLFEEQFAGLDNLIQSIPLEKEKISKVFLSYKDGYFKIEYFIREDCVPLTYK